MPATYERTDKSMCGRYYIDDEDSPEELQRIIDALNRSGDTSVKRSGEIFPGDTVPVLALNRKLDIRPFGMRWGYSLGRGRLVINARSESAGSSPMFSDGMINRRCLFPASAYFEWKRDGVKSEKHRIFTPDSKMFYMAGIYRLSGGSAECAILTKAPCERVSTIHDRMPVILSPGSAFGWLDRDIQPAEMINRAESAVDFERCDQRRQ